MLWLGRFFVKLQFERELFWTDRKAGGRLYHLFNIGVYDMSHIEKGCGSFSLTLLFVSFKFGWTAKR